MQQWSGDPLWSKQPGSHTSPTCRPTPLCIQDNRFREYLMKSLHWISIFYQQGWRHAENNNNNNRRNAWERGGEIERETSLVKVKRKLFYFLVCRCEFTCFNVAKWNHRNRKLQSSTGSKLWVTLFHIFILIWGENPNWTPWCEMRGTEHFKPPHYEIR